MRCRLVCYKLIKRRAAYLRTTLYLNHMFQTQNLSDRFHISQCYCDMPDKVRTREVQYNIQLTASEGQETMICGANLQQNEA